jgi:FkbM family methyltransferase
MFGRGPFLERHRRRDRTRVLPTGLTIHGASAAQVRSQETIEDYFEAGFDVQPGMTVFDIGANIGLFSLEVLRRSGGQIELFCFEPAPDTFDLLERNIRESFPSATVRLYRSAVSSQAGEATFYHRPRVSSMSSLSPDPLIDADSLLRDMLRQAPAKFPAWLHRLPARGGERMLGALGRWSQAKVVETTCRVTTISDVIDEHDLSRADFLKVDVEGAELDVLRGIRRDHWPRVSRLAVEVHDIDGRVAEMRQLLESAGFERIRTEQHWPFEGTNVYILHAARSQS